MKIVEYPHPALRHPVKPLANIDKQVHLYVGKMLDLMYEANGLGLAANHAKPRIRIGRKASAAYHGKAPAAHAARIAATSTACPARNPRPVASFPRRSAARAA